ncbi:beta-L-arabinofuranosidase domain-containing protein [Hymenobacter rigui]|nr:beta-L-arabinofuranosidase domain-containing protein [Hymenobacter rigui]
MKHLLMLTACCLTAAAPAAAQPTPGSAAPVPATAFQMVQPRPAAFEPLWFGEVKPTGWLLAQMRHDLQHGFVGQLDALVPDLITRDDIYGRDRLTTAVKSKSVGAISAPSPADVQYLWWNSETQSNWWDGFVRTALLTDDAPALARARQYVKRILATQDPDGYLGIYAPDLRFHFTGENGELWAQATLLRGLLGYYETTRDARVLRAVERAVAVTMRAYPVRQSAPFAAASGGVAHGLTFTDTLERLYQLTGQQRYRDYALWLYEDFSTRPATEADAQLGHLLDPDYRFQAHGAHTYEHLRTVVQAAYNSGNPVLQAGLQGYLAKLDACLAPSGGPIGDEWIAGRTASAAATGYEYCSIHELTDSYALLLQRSGNTRWADRLEWLTFNAGQGARYPGGSAIAYLKTDNSFSMTGPLHPGDAPVGKDPQTRYKYSPVHQDVAVCCVPNAGRLYPYYTRTMWLRTPEGGLLAALYGPCEVRTTVQNTPVHLVEETAYPLELTGTITVSADKPTAFDVVLRQPAWAGRLRVKVPAGATVREADGLVYIRKIWGQQERIRFELPAAVQQHTDAQGDAYFSHGPLVYALPLPGTPTATKAYPVPGFQDVQLTSTAPADFTLPTRSGAFRPVPAPAGLIGWDHTPRLRGTVQAPGSARTVPVELLPMGSTALRRVTFARPAAYRP